MNVSLPGGAMSGHVLQTQRRQLTMEGGAFPNADGCLSKGRYSYLGEEAAGVCRAESTTEKICRSEFKML